MFVRKMPRALGVQGDPPLNLEVLLYGIVLQMIGCYQTTLYRDSFDRTPPGMSCVLGTLAY